MTNQQDLMGRIEAAVDYSHNFATAKPNIGGTEKEHILGLVALVREAAAQLGRVDVPDGWVLVPRVSTSEMDIAGAFAAKNLCINGFTRDEAEFVWDAMLAVAPQPDNKESR